MNNTAINSLADTEGADSIHLTQSDEDNFTTVQPYNMELYNQQIKNFYQQLLVSRSFPIIHALNYFLGSSYFLEPLGEGKRGQYSQEPIYRTDKFDCVSYVNTVLALMNAKNLTQFKKNIKLIRYTTNQVDYINRTDWFSDLEWFPHVQKLGWIKDVTGQIVDENQLPIAMLAKTNIDKPNWYKVKPLKMLHLFASTLTDANQLLSKLRAEGNNFIIQSAQIAYLPLDKLFNADGNANDYLFNQIPSGSVIAIVRPNWPIRDEFPGFSHGYGTNLNVSHLGVVLRVGQELLFYNASSLHHKIESELLKQYLKKYNGSPTIKGIHVEQIIY